MNLNIEIRPVIMADAPGACQVWLVVGQQQFSVGNAHETREEGDWYAGMLRKALDADLAMLGRGRQ